jgi:hypothetical protein
MHQTLSYSAMGCLEKMDKELNNHNWLRRRCVVLLELHCTPCIICDFHRLSIDLGLDSRRRVKHENAFIFRVRVKSFSID